MQQHFYSTNMYENQTTIFKFMKTYERKQFYDTLYIRREILQICKHNHQNLWKLMKIMKIHEHVWQPIRNHSTNQWHVLAKGQRRTQEHTQTPHSRARKHTKDWSNLAAKGEGTEAVWPDLTKFKQFGNILQVFGQFLKA